MHDAGGGGVPRRSLRFSLLAAGIVLSCRCGGSASPGPPVAEGGAGGDSSESGTIDDGAPQGGKTCTSDADCASPLVCGWEITDGCGVPGHCAGKPVAICNVVEPPACGCDGSDVPVLCGWPYVTKPVRSRSGC